MDQKRWNQIEDLFLKALEVCPDERHRFLDQACDGDDSLRREIVSLLACDDPNVPLLSLNESAPEMADRRFGPYRLVRLLGQGGMGSVHLASRDDDQFRKQVAIKLLKRGMDTDAMLMRFRQERQILANLEHPFIARLIDGGATDDGLPYFVMEYVDGIPITKYCADKGLSIPERLRLFCMVCEAVQHAHQNLVVHRDIKPSNILTTKEGTPKLLDFGIAKVLDPSMAAGATLTQQEFRMLTPDYASPEQMKALPVSTASDTYSLGAVLYELLAGKSPHRFTSGSLADMENAICLTEPLKPSAVAAESEDIPAGLRKQLKRQLCGDLDNIVLTALRKEPQRRYASPAEFAEDLRRHIEGLPVLAHEDRWSYRAGKFIRRNRLAVGAASLVAISLIGGIVSTTIQVRRAEQRFQIVRGLAKTTLFDLYNEMERLPGSISLRVATIRTVVKYLDALAQGGSQDPDLDLEIATAYERVANLEGHPFMSNLGHGTEALSNYRKALTIFERLAKRSDYRRQATRGLIDVHLKISRLESLLGNPQVALSHSNQASEIASAAFAIGKSELPLSTQINVYFRLADLAYDRGAADEELANYRKALELSKTWAADEGSDASARMVEAYRNVGSALARGGNLAGALESYRSAQKAAEELARRKDVKPDHQVAIVGIHTATGDILGAPDDPNFGDRAAALTRYQEALAIAERLAAADFKNVNGRRTLAACQWRLGMILAEDQPARAVEYCRKALQISEEVGAGDPRNVEYRYHASRAYLWMGEALQRLRRHDEAVASLTRALDLQNAIEVGSPERIWNLRVLSRTYVSLGDALLGAGDPDRALDSLSRGLAAADRMLRRAPTSLSHQLDRADVLEAMGRYYVALARRPGVGGPRRVDLRRQARSRFQQSLAIWQSWTRRKLAEPYATRRESKAALAIASIE